MKCRLLFPATEKRKYPINVKTITAAEKDLLRSLRESIKKQYRNIMKKSEYRGWGKWQLIGSSLIKSWVRFRSDVDPCDGTVACPN